jgi:hypothetical protein
MQLLSLAMYSLGSVSTSKSTGAALAASAPKHVLHIVSDVSSHPSSGVYI